MRKARVLFSAILILGQLAFLPIGESIAFANEPLDPVVITEVQTGPSSDELIELYNPNSEPLALTGLFLWHHGGGLAPTLNQLVDLSSVIIDAKQFVVFGHTSSTDIVIEINFSGHLTDSAGAVFVAPETFPGSKMPVNIIDKVAWGAAASGEAYHFYDVATAKAPAVGKSIERCFIDDKLNILEPRNTSGEFIVYSEPSLGIGTVCIPSEPPVPVVECIGLAINEIGANIDEQYIELYNPTDTPIAIGGCKLQTNRNKNTHVLTQSELAPGEYMTVFIADTNLTLTKTTTGEVYVLSSDGLTETDIQAYEYLSAGSSWSYFTDGWRQTFELTPNSQNVYLPYPPCDDGYFRNTVTGRCNVVPTIASLTPCRDGQYRNEATGRCRNLTTVQTRKPCRDDQYRSEETGRCRNLVLASTRKPCKDNQYRSEETGRCRNLSVTTVPPAGFAVQPIKENGMAFVGWWALGGVIMLVGAYGAWEWRREVLSFIRILFRRP